MAAAAISSFVGWANIIAEYLIPASYCSAQHGSLAISAEYHPGQWVYNFVLRRCTSIPFQHALHKREGQRLNDRSMVILHDNPILFFPHPHGFNLIIWCSPFALDQPSNVNGVCQYPADWYSRPTRLRWGPEARFILQSLASFIVRRWKDLLVIQKVCNCLLIISLKLQWKNAPDNLGCIIVHDKLMLIIRRLTVPIVGKGT